MSPSEKLVISTKATQKNNPCNCYHHESYIRGIFYSKAGGRLNNTLLSCVTAKISDFLKVI
jgi:hypothetical protein